MGKKNTTTIRPYNWNTSCKVIILILRVLLGSNINLYDVCDLQPWTQKVCSYIFHMNDDDLDVRLLLLLFFFVARPFSFFSRRVVLSPHQVCAAVDANVIAERICRRRRRRRRHKLERAHLINMIIIIKKNKKKRGKKKNRRKKKEKKKKWASSSYYIGAIYYILYMKIR